MSEDDLLPKYECSICNDTGYIAENNSFTKCSCLKQKLINISYNKSNINKLDFENFSNFDINISICLKLFSYFFVIILFVILL